MMTLVVRMRFLATFARELPSRFWKVWRSSFWKQSKELLRGRGLMAEASRLLR
jgi:hypothetical protein